MRRLISLTLYKPLVWLLTAVLLVLSAIVWVLRLPGRALDWLELWAVFKGDKQARDRAEWKTSL